MKKKMTIVLGKNPLQEKILEAMRDPERGMPIIEFPRHCGRTVLNKAIREMELNHNPAKALKSAFESPSIINKHF